MNRGNLYRTRATPGRDPHSFRVYVVVSRQELINSKYSTVVCAPVYTRRRGMDTEVLVGPDEGMRHDSSIRCDDLLSILKGDLTAFVGSLSTSKIKELDLALMRSLDLDGSKG